MEKIQYYMNIIAAGIFMGVGVTSNLMVLIVLLSDFKIRAHPVNIYLATLTLPDTVRIIIYLFQAIPTIVPISPIYCKILMGSLNTSYSLSNFFNAVVSIDRLLSVYYPKKFLFKNKLTFQLKFIFISFLVYIIACSTSYFIFTEIKEEINNITVSYCAYDQTFYGLLNDIYILFIANIIPIVLMTCSAILLTKRLVKLSKNLRKHVDMKSKNFIKLILTLNIYFVVTQLPVCILIILEHFSLATKMNPELFIFVYNVSNILSLTYYSFSFFVYFSINKMFRLRFIEMVKSLCFIRSLDK